MNDVNPRPRISVILPLFEIGALVDEAISDLLDQSHADWEAVFVDDRSGDDAAGRVERAAARDPRIRLVRQAERGFAGAARNRGIEEARGDYLLFLDPDDRYEPSLMEKTLASALAHDSDVVLFNADRFDDASGRVSPLAGFPASDTRLDGVFRPQDVPDALFGAVMYVPWLGLFKRSFVSDEGLRFQPLHSANDVFFVAVARACAKRMSRVPDILVHYRTGRQSSTSRSKALFPLDTFEAFRTTYGELRKRGLFETYRDGFVPSALRSCLFCLETALKDPVACRTFYDRLKNGGLDELGFGETGEEAFTPETGGKALLERIRAIQTLSYDEFCVLAIGEAAQFRRHFLEQRKRRQPAAAALAVTKGPFRGIRATLLRFAVALLRDGPGGLAASIREERKARARRRWAKRLDKAVKPLRPIGAFEAVARANARRPSGLPLVTTVVTTFNHEKYVESAIQGALAQTGRFRHRILLADDGSTDGTRDIVRRYAARYPDLVEDVSSDGNLGISGNLKRVFSLVEGDFVALLEGDDLWLSPAKLDRQIRFLAKNPACSMVFSRIALYEENGPNWRWEVCQAQEGLPGRLSADDIVSAFNENPLVNFSCCLFRVPLVKSIPPELFKNRLSEISLAFHMERSGPIGFLPEILSAYRVHASGVWSGATQRDKLLQQIGCREAALAVCNPACAERLRAVIAAKRAALDQIGVRGLAERE